MCHLYRTPVVRLAAIAPPFLASLSRYLTRKGIDLNLSGTLIIGRCEGAVCSKVYYVDPETDQHILIEDDPED